MVVDRSGDLWVGLHAAVVEITRAGELHFVRLPALPLAAAHSGLLTPPPSPLPATDYQGVDEMALTKDGSIVIGRMFTTRMLVLNPSTWALRSVALPSSSELSLGTGALAGNGTGNVGAILYTARGRSEAAEFTGTSWLIAPSGCQPQSVSAAGRSLLFAGSSCALMANRVAGQALSLRKVAHLPGTFSAVTMGGATSAQFSATGVTVVRGKRSTQLRLGTIETAPSSNPRGDPDVPNEIRYLPIEATLSAPDGRGGLWVLPNGSVSIAHLSPNE